MAEHTCIFVSSRGLAKSCDVRPDFTVHQIPEASQRKEPSVGDITVYLRASFFSKYFETGVLDRIQTPVVLVVGDDDDLCPVDFPTLASVLDSPMVKAIWVQNLIRPSIHPKLHNLPIGLDYHTLSYNVGEHAWGESNVPPVKQEHELLRMQRMIPVIYDCKPRCVTNFQLAMNMPRREVFRIPAYEALKDKPFVEFLPAMPRSQFWQSIGDAAFVISPPGNGVDCHRTWEALCISRIPIVQRTGIESLFDNLPVLVVDSYEDVTQDLLDTFLHVAKQRWHEYQWSKLTLRWWTNQIRNSVLATN